MYKHIRSTQGWLVLIQLIIYSALLLQDSELSTGSAFLVDQRLLHWWLGNLSTSYVLPEAGSVTHSTRIKTENYFF
jgi:hypothetical protein